MVSTREMKQEQLIELADQALYKAKDNGRNQTFGASALKLVNTSRQSV